MARDVDGRAVRPAACSTRRPGSTSPTSPPTRSSSGGGGTTTPRRPASPNPTRWSSPRPTTTADPTPASCSSAASTSAGFVFHTNYDSPKSRQLDGEPARRRRVRLARPAPPGARARPDRAGQRRRERRLLRLAARATARSGRGRRRRARCSPTAPSSTAAIADDRGASSPAATCRGPSSGAAGASASTRSSSGRAARAASTTASATAAVSRRLDHRAPRALRRRQVLATWASASTQRGGRRHEAVAVPVGPPRPEPAHARRQLELHAAARRHVHRVRRVQAAQLARDRRQVGDDLVLRAAPTPARGPSVAARSRLRPPRSSDVNMPSRP